MINPYSEVHDDLWHRRNIEYIFSKLGIYDFHEVSYTFYGTGITIQNPSANTIIVDGACVGSSDTITLTDLPAGIHSMRFSK